MVDREPYEIITVKSGLIKAKKPQAYNNIISIYTLSGPGDVAVHKSIDIPH